MQSLNLSHQPNRFEETPKHKTAQEWWNEITGVAAIFFQWIEELPKNLSGPEMKSLAEQLDMTRTRVEDIDFPFETYHARSYLLAALTDLVTGLRRSVNGDPGMGQAYIKAAQIEMNFLNEELEELEIS